MKIIVFISILFFSATAIAFPGDYLGKSALPECPDGWVNVKNKKNSKRCVSTGMEVFKSQDKIISIVSRKTYKSPSDAEIDYYMVAAEIMNAECFPLDSQATQFRCDGGAYKVLITRVATAMIVSYMR